MPDVRVRLSAEGQQEVINAFRRVQAESEKTSKKSARGFLDFNHILGNTTHLLGAMGLAVSAVSFVHLIKQGVEAAEHLGKLGEKVGATVEHLSALSLIAKENEIDIDGMTTAMARMNKRLAAAAEGNPEAVKALRKIGLTVKDFDGKDAAQAFELIAKGLQSVEEGAPKTKAAMDIFGRSGFQMIPMLNALATEGLDPLIERARELGVLIDDKTAQSIRDLHDGIRRLKLQAEVAGASFFSGFAGPVTEAMGLISGEVSKSSEVWKELGKTVGLTVEVIVGVVSIAVDAIFSLWRQAVTVTTTGGRMLSAALKADWGTVAAEWAIARDRIESESDAVDARVKARLRTLQDIGKEPLGPERPPKRAPNVLGDDLEAELAQRAEMTKTALDAELAMWRLEAKARSDADRRAFEEGLIGVHEYFRRRREISQEETKLELANLAKRKELLASEEDPVKRESETAKVEVQIQTVKVQEKTDLAALSAEELEAVRKLGEERLGVEAKVLEAQGKRHEAALLAIDDEVRKENLRLQKLQVPEEVRTAAVERIRGALTAVADFEEIQRRAEAGMEELGRARSAIEDQVSAGFLSEEEGEKRILEIEKDRLALLRELAASLLAAAEATGDPSKIATALAYADALAKVEMQAAATDKELQRLKEGIGGAIGQAMLDFFDRGIEESKNLGEAVRNMAASIIRDIKRIAAEMIVLKILGAIGFSAGGKVEGKARGGVLGGVGGPTADANLAYFSRGEYLVRAASVRQPGVLTLLEQLNRQGSRAVPSVARRARGGILGAKGEPVGVISRLEDLHRLVAGGGLPGFARGGVLGGVGGPTADANLAYFSRGEYLVRAASVREPGVLPILEEINRRGALALEVPELRRYEPARYSDGGLVDSVQSPTASPPPGRPDSIEIGLEEGLVIRRMDTPSGRKMLVQMLSKTRRSARSALGG